jgi:hypothetical protein
MPSYVYAQQSEDKTKQIEKKIDELAREAAALRNELDRLKVSAPEDAATVQPLEDDLTEVEIVQPAQPDETPEPSAPSPAEAIAPEEIQVVSSGADPNTAKIFNPDIAVIGTMLGHVGDSNAFEFGPDETRAPFDLGEVEIALEAFVDPYAKGRFFLAIGEEGIEVEEGYAEFLTLPGELIAKAGKKKAVFGKANTWHTHIRPWVDQPLVIHNFFGDEGLADIGISISRIFPTSTFYTEVTAEVFSGGAEGVFERQNQNDLFYNSHVRFFRDLNENSNIELGTSYARGTGQGSARTSQFAGLDVSYRWKPLQQGTYRGLIARFEAMVNDRLNEDRLSGFYASADWKLAQRWILGARLDRSDRAFPVGDDFDDDPGRDRGASLLLTFQPSEFSRIRGQVRRVSYGDERSVNELLLQLQFAIGAHGAHTF